MRCTIFPLLLALLLFAVPATATPLIGVQGRLTAVGGGVVPDGDYSLIVKIYAAQDDVVALWKETQLAVSVQSGLFAFGLGSADANNPLPAELFATHTDTWLGVQVVPDDAELPRVQLRPVPYALQTNHADFADKAAVAKDLDCIGCVKPLQVAFSWAASTMKGGAAQDLACSGCIGPAQIAAGSIGTTQLTAGAITAAKIAPGAVGAAALGVNWAMGKAAGGDALSALDLQCVGCVSAEELAQGLVAKLLPIATDKVLGGVMVGAHLQADAKGVLSVIDGDFLPLTGGTITGALGVNGTLTAKGGINGSGKAITAFRVENIGAAPPCAAPNAGRMYFDTAKKIFYGCDGANWKALHK